jgi:hypothetical protein
MNRLNEYKEKKKDSSIAIIYAQVQIRNSDPMFIDRYIILMSGPYLLLCSSHASDKYLYSLDCPSPLNLPVPAALWILVQPQTFSVLGTFGAIQWLQLTFQVQTIHLDT